MEGNKIDGTTKVTDDKIVGVGPTAEQAVQAAGVFNGNILEDVVLCLFVLTRWLIWKSLGTLPTYGVQVF